VSLIQMYDEKNKGKRVVVSRMNGNIPDERATLRTPYHMAAASDHEEDR